MLTEHKEKLYAFILRIQTPVIKSRKKHTLLKPIKIRKTETDTGNCIYKYE